MIMKSKTCSSMNSIIHTVIQLIIKTTVARAKIFWTHWLQNSIDFIGNFTTDSIKFFSRDVTVVKISIRSL